MLRSLLFVEKSKFAPKDAKILYKNDTTLLIMLTFYVF